MSKNYSVARVAQLTAAGIGKSERHIERKNESYENMNVDLTRTPMNVHFASRPITPGWTSWWLMVPFLCAA